MRYSSQPEIILPGTKDKNPSERLFSPLNDREGEKKRKSLTSNDADLY